ncbi:hypothetical protein BJX99DRAFT_227851 [Aspergillus californicus]
MIEEAALKILGFSYVNSISNPPQLSKMWKYRFLENHPEFKKGLRRFKEQKRGREEDPARGFKQEREKAT